MSIRPRHFLLALLTSIVAAGLCPARADDADTVKEKLFQAKKDYDAELQKFKNAIADLLDKREDAARKAGNKKMVDQAKAEREMFEKTGEFPSIVTSAIREPVISARAKLDKAYSAAIKECVRLKMDDAAGIFEKEQQEVIFSSAIQIGKKRFVSSLHPMNVKVWDNKFEKDANDYELEGKKIPHSIFMHADAKGEGKGEASVNYILLGKCLAFQASIGIPKHMDRQEQPFSAATFEVLGDGKSLWKSEPVEKIGTFQECKVNIDKVKTLTLRVSCKDYHWVHAVWFGPIVIE
jgi:hypothetical protein